MEPEPERPRLGGRDREGVVRGGLRALLLGIDRLPATVDDTEVDAVLDEGRPVGGLEETLGVGLVLGEEERGRAFTGEVPRTELGVRGRDHPRARLPQHGAHRVAAPRPRVADPHRRQHVERGRLRAAVLNGDLDEEVLRKLDQIFPGPGGPAPEAYAW